MLQTKQCSSDLLLEFGLIASFSAWKVKKGTCPCVPLALVAAPSCHNVRCCKPCPKIRCLAQVALSRAPTNPQCRGGFELGMVLCHNPLHCTETDKDRPTHPHGKICLGMFLKPLKLRHNPYHLLSDQRSPLFVEKNPHSNASTFMKGGIYFHPAHPGLDSCGYKFHSIWELQNPFFMDYD